MPSTCVITARLTVFSVHWQLSLLLLKSDSFHMTCHSKRSSSFLALFLNYKFVCHLVGLFQRHYFKSHDSLVHLSHFVDQLQLISFTHIKNSLTAAIAQVFICWEHALVTKNTKVNYGSLWDCFHCGEVCSRKRLLVTVQEGKGSMVCRSLSWAQWRAQDFRLLGVKKIGFNERRHSSRVRRKPAWPAWNILKEVIGMPTKMI